MDNHLIIYLSKISHKMLGILGFTTCRTTSPQSQQQQQQQQQQQGASKPLGSESQHGAGGRSASVKLGAFLSEKSVMLSRWITLPETNIAPEHGGFQ